MKKTTKKAANKAPKDLPKTTKKTEAEKRKVNLSVSVRKGEMVHHQRMLSQDVNAQATQHIIGLPVNKSRYNGYGGMQMTNAKLKQMRTDPESVRIIPIGGVGEFGIGKNMTIIEYNSHYATYFHGNSSTPFSSNARFCGYPVRPVVILKN